MRTVIENVSRPGEPAQAGDIVIFDYGNGRTKTSQYSVPTDMPPASSHKEEFSPAELLESFTSDEAISASMSNDAQIQGQMKVLGLRRAKAIHKDDPGYIGAIDLLLAKAVFTQATADDYRPGIPVERLP